jgi:hypothetical protein
MLLITEYFDDSVMTIQEDANGVKQLYIEGIYAQGGIVNRNGRKYPERILDAAMEKYVAEKVNTNRALGELNHPNRPLPDAKEASHRVVELHKDGLNWIGKSIVLETIQGNCVRALLKGGTSIGVSTRALGSLKNVGGVNEVQSDLMMGAIDCVTDPSAPEAFVNGIMEGVEFFKSEDGRLFEKTVDEIQREVRATSLKDLPAKYIEIFERVMNSTFKAT